VAAEMILGLDVEFSCMYSEEADNYAHELLCPQLSSVDL
jgi:hypothetical protein